MYAALGLLSLATSLLAAFVAGAAWMVESDLSAIGSALCSVVLCYVGVSDLVHASRKY